MSPLLKSLVLSAPIMLSTASLANAWGFDSTVTSQLTTAVKLEVVLSEDLAHRADNLPEKLSDRSGGGGRSTAFSDNGHYGERDLNRLQERLEKRLSKQFMKRGIELSADAPTVLRVTLEDVKNNRPTFRQLGQDPGLSYSSIGIGGAEIDAELITAGGASLGTMTYEWYEDDFRDAQFAGTWTDTHRAIDRFAKRAAKNLAAGSQS